MFNLSFSAYDYAYYDDLFLTSSYSNLTQWQREQIHDFPDEGRHCMIDFWASPLPQGICVQFKNLCHSFRAMN